MAAQTVAQFLSALPADRRHAIETTRAAIARHLPKGYEEVLEFGMISWVVPLARYANTYNGRPLMVAALGAQKHHMAVYLMGIYGDPSLRASFEAAYRATGKRFDVGKSCVRFKTLDDLPLEVIAKAAGALGVDAFIAAYERARPAATKKAATPKIATKKVATKKVATKKTATSKAATKKAIKTPTAPKRAKTPASKKKVLPKAPSRAGR